MNRPRIIWFQPQDPTVIDLNCPVFWQARRDNVALYEKRVLLEIARFGLATAATTILLQQYRAQLLSLTAIDKARKAQGLP